MADQNDKQKNNANKRNRRQRGRLDPLDCKLVRLLQKDGRMPNTVLAHKLEVSEYTVRTRLNRLLEDDVIRIVATSKPINLGFEVAGNLKIRIDLKKTDYVLKKLKEIDAVIWVALTTGGTDLDVDFVTKSLKELQHLIFKQISQIDGILSTETSLLVDLVKDKSDWGTAWD